MFQWTVIAFKSLHSCPHIMSAPVIPSLTKRGQHKHNDALKSLQVPFLSYLSHFILNMPFLNNLLTNGMTVPKTSADYRVN